MDAPVTQQRHTSLAARLAYVLSVVMTPAVTATATMALIVWRFEPGWRGAAYLGMMVLSGTVFGMALAFVRARRKGLSDVHIHDRRDRPWFFGTCVGAAAAGWVVLKVTGASTGLLVFMGAYCVCLGVIALMTLVTKPSVHCAAMTALGGALLIVRPVFVLPAAVGLAALMWARLYRKRHTFAQCVFGIAIGAATVAAGYVVWQLLA